jgi:membrane protein
MARRSRRNARTEDRPVMDQRPAAPGGGEAATPSRPRWDRLTLRVLGRATSNFIEDRGTHLSAAISYYGLFSLFPLTLLAVSIFGIVLRSPAMQDRVLDEVLTQLPIDPGNQGSIQQALKNAASLGPTLSVVSFLGALWTAGALSAAIRSALNVIFQAPRSRPLLRGKLIDYALIPVIGLPFLGGIVVTTGWRIAQHRVVQLPFVQDRAVWVWELGVFLIPLALSFFAFLLLYWMVPNHRVRFRYAWGGALLAAILFEGLKVGFAYYLANFASYDVIYGPISSVIVLLFWVYLTANITLFGAEVAAETPHVVLEEPRHGGSAGEGDWRQSLRAFLRGLVLAGDDDGAPAHHEPPPGEHAAHRPDAAAARAASRRR